MQVKELNKEGLKTEMEITVAASELDKKIDQKLLSLAPQVKLKGFRPGKAPLKVLRANYARSVMGEVLEQAVNESTRDAMKEKGITPAGQPKIEVKTFDQGQDLVYTIEVESFPEFELPDFKSLEIERQYAEVTDEEIDKTIERFAEAYKESKPVEEDRPAVIGDMVEIDFTGQADDGTKLPGMDGNGVKLEIGAQQFIPGFEEQLEGLKTGDTKDVKVTFPENYQEKALAGKEATFNVTLKSVAEPVRPEINEEFAKKYGYESLEKLREDVSDKIGAEYENMSKSKMKRRVLDVLDAQYDFDLPQSNVEEEFGSIVSQVESERHQAHHHDGNGEEHAHDHDHAHHTHVTDEEREEFRAIAARRVKLGILLARIGEENNLKVSEADIQKAVIREAANYPGQEQMIQNYYRNNPNAMEALRANIFEELTMDFILELVQKKERKVSAEELAKPEDHEADQTDEADKDKKDESRKADGKKSGKFSTGKASGKASGKAKSKDDAGEKKTTSQTSGKTSKAKTKTEKSQASE